jgi:hypothetical protein
VIVIVDLDAADPGKCGALVCRALGEDGADPPGLYKGPEVSAGDPLLEGTIPDICVEIFMQIFHGNGNSPLDRVYIVWGFDALSPIGEQTNDKAAFVNRRSTGVGIFWLLE